jgi:hypothetical protein
MPVEFGKIPLRKFAQTSFAIITYHRRFFQGKERVKSDYLFGEKQRTVRAQIVQRRVVNG